MEANGVFPAGRPQVEDWGLTNALLRPSDLGLIRPLVPGEFWRGRNQPATGTTTATTPPPPASGRLDSRYLLIGGVAVGAFLLLGRRR